MRMDAIASTGTPTSGDSIILEGAWSIDQAACNKILLACRLAQLLELEPEPDRVEMDLSEISDLDACGCQLLVVFLENLKRRGIISVVYRPKQRIMDSVDEVVPLGEMSGRLITWLASQGKRASGYDARGST